MQVSDLVEIFKLYSPSRYEQRFLKQFLRGSEFIGKFEVKFLEGVRAVQFGLRNSKILTNSDRCTSHHRIVSNNFLYCTITLSFQVGEQIT